MVENQMQARDLPSGDISEKKMVRIPDRTTVQKAGKNLSGGTRYIVREPRSGKSIEVTSTPTSARIIKESAARNAELLKRLADR